MKCSECGRTIDHNSTYCCYCGEKQKKVVEKTKKSAPSDLKIVLIVVSILVVFVLLIFGFFFTVGSIVYEEMENQSTQENPPMIEKYQGELPVLKRNYKKVHTVNLAGFDNQTLKESMTYLKQMGFMNISENTQLYDDECRYEIVAQSYPYDHLNERDRIVLCYGKDQKINSLKVEFIFTASDFSYDQAINEILDASFNFHHLPLNESLMKDAFLELRSDMKNFEHDPSASREEVIDHKYEVEYELDYDDETTYLPALYTIELNIEIVDK